MLVSMHRRGLARRSSSCRPGMVLWIQPAESSCKRGRASRIAWASSSRTKCSLIFRSSLVRLVAEPMAGGSQANSFRLRSRFCKSAEGRDARAATLRNRGAAAGRPLQRSLGSQRQALL